MQRSSVLMVSLITLVLSTSPVLAHTGAGSTLGFSSGFGHPISGLDHVLAMIAVGILAAQQGGNAVWLVPASFLFMMVVGGTMGHWEYSIPYVEIGILGSVIVLGGVIALGRKMPTLIAMAMTGTFALFHGHAHGTEMPADSNSILYVLGFVIATTILHALGVFAGILYQTKTKEYGRAAAKAIGSAISLAGLVLALA